MRSQPSRRTLVLLFGSAFLLYLAYLPRFFVGSFNDDAIFVLAAKSLLQGHYRSLYLSEHPPINQFLPGYPIFLVPWVWLFEPHWAWLKGASIGLTLLSGWLVWMLWRDRPGRWPYLVVGVFLVNPVIALYSGSVMSDVCFTAASLLVFVVLRAYGARPSCRGMWAMAAVLSWAILIRPVGAILLPAVFLGLVSANKTKLAWRPVALAGLIWIAYYLRTYLATHATYGYLAQLQNSLPSLMQHPGLVLYNVLAVLRSFFVDGILSRPWTSSSWPFALLSYLAGLLCLGVTVKGYRLLLSQKALPHEVLVAMGVWGGVYLVFHVSWTALQVRHGLPFIPLALPFFLTGMSGVCDRFPRPRTAAVLGLLLWGTGYATVHAQMLTQTWSTQRPIESLLPQQTYAWINTHLPAESQLLSKQPVTYLYTQRGGLTGIGAMDLEEFRYQLAKRQLSYILGQPYHVLEVMDPGYSIQNMWDRDMGWAAAWPSLFPLIYQNEPEGTKIYQVVPDPKFVQAYDLKISAEQAFAEGKSKEALDQLLRADRLSPGSVQILNALGGAYLDLKQIPQAEAAYLHALKLRPNHPLTHLSLAELYRRKGQITLAREHLQKCEQILEGSPELRRFAPVIADEKARLSTPDK